MDFPHGQDDAAVFDWLDKKKFDKAITREKFKKYDADALMGLAEGKIIDFLGREDGDRLWALLNTAKQKAPQQAPQLAGKY